MFHPARQAAEQAALEAGLRKALALTATAAELAFSGRNGLDAGQTLASALRVAASCNLGLQELEVARATLEQQLFPRMRSSQVRVSTNLSASMMHAGIDR